ncbi:D-serine deaminase, pyridoxal phosphate-dependent [Tessaracoccus bendigoensis DSM 12906]|uniref:D-serine deaminase, pyridoxal phosphate-dependent n=1 Tax=Tessaracoccus bendigoensis DSM 12906 TaxID=1123357 RepID=A0A1M6JZB0_9ACTN|nr:alanine racemase [Tessaracoccus bendigoensis]SHJ52056.1 D-serine deaminase, pyridoxal phosphate-dependent [Tessaracoccus bendigoensis DSM 12906]
MRRPGGGNDDLQQLSGAAVVTGHLAALIGDVRHLSPPSPEPWRLWDEATATEEPPFAVLDLSALRANAADLLRRADGVPIRVASKSLRVRAMVEELLAVPGFEGVLAYTLPEALWLAETCPDVVVGYPSADRGAIAELARSERAAAAVTLMIDCVEQLDLIDEVVAPSHRHPIRVCLELDAAWQGPMPLGRLGVLRSPLRTPAQVRALAEVVVRRSGFKLVGLMAYEAQVAGVADAVPGRRPMNSVVSWIKRRSRPEIAERRAAVVAAVRQVAELEFVNGGGTGSIESTAQDAAVTEIAAGSGLFAGHYFDSYQAFSPHPATGFALSVVRKPRADCVTVLGGGWVASGPPGPDRLPKVAFPADLRLAPREMTGEVQTPLVGQPARGMRVGDRVWFRHAKSGELSEHVNEFVLVDQGRVIDRLPTYRGEGRAFL